MMDFLGLGAGAVASAYGQHLANKANLKIAREQMAFQERMSSSSYQRAVKDLKLAGINPMLAISKGGASTPGGASAKMENELAGAASNALSLLRFKKELRLLQSQTYKTDQEGLEAKARTAYWSQNAVNITAGTPFNIDGHSWAAMNYRERNELLRLQQELYRKDILLRNFQMPKARIEGSSAAALLRLGTGAASSLLNPLRLIRGAKGTINLQPTTFIKVPGRR